MNSREKRIIYTFYSCNSNFNSIFNSIQFHFQIKLQFFSSWNQYRIHNDIFYQKLNENEQIINSKQHKHDDKIVDENFNKTGDAMNELQIEKNKQYEQINLFKELKYKSVNPFITTNQLQFIYNQVQEYIEKCNASQEQISKIHLYNTISKSTKLNRAIVRKIAQKFIDQILRFDNKRIEQVKDKIIPIIVYWQKTHNLSAQAILKKRKNSLYKEIEKVISMPRIQIREIVRNILLRNIENDIGKVTILQKEKAKNILESFDLINKPSAINNIPTDCYLKIEESTGLSRRQINRLIESLSSESKSINKQDREIIKNLLNEFLEFKNENSINFSDLYTIIQKHTSLNRIQIRRLVQQELLKLNRKKEMENRQFISNYLNYNNNADLRDLYSLLQEKFTLSRDRARELVHQEIQKQKSVEISSEMKEIIRNIVHSNENMKTNQIYDIIQEKLEIPRSQIRHIVRSILKKNQSKNHNFV